MVKPTVSVWTSPLFYVIKWIGIALVILGLLFGWVIVFNFGTLLRVGIFVLGLFIAKKILFGGN
jgi:hypothetical protein